MATRFRKSKSLGGGVKLNVSKKSVGISIGTKGLRTSVSSSGRKTTSMSIPGTGLGYVKSSGGGSTAPARSSGGKLSASSAVESSGGRVVLQTPDMPISVHGGRVKPAKTQENQPGMALAGFGMVLCVIGIVLMLVGLLVTPLLVAAVVFLLAGIPLAIIGYTKNARYKRLRLVARGDDSV